MHTKRTAALLLTVGGVVVATISGLIPAWADLAWGWRFSGIAAGLMSIVAAVAMDRLSGAVTVKVGRADWVQRIGTNGEVDYYVTIPRSRHGRRAPQVSLYEPKPGGGFVEVFSDVEISEDGAVVVAAPEPEALEIRIN